MDVYKDTQGQWHCKICGTVHQTLKKAVDCVDSHEASKNALQANQPQSDVEQVLDTSDRVTRYRAALQNGPLDPTKILALALLEDYELSRAHDLSSKSRPGPLTLNFGKNAAELLVQLNKIVYGEKSTSMSVTASADKVGELEALREAISGNPSKKKNDEAINV